MREFHVVLGRMIDLIPSDETALLAEMNKVKDGLASRAPEMLWAVDGGYVRDLLAMRFPNIKISDVYTDAPVTLAPWAQKMFAIWWGHE